MGERFLRQMSMLLLDTNALVALSDPAHPLFLRIEQALAQGDTAATNAIAWHEFARGPLLPEDLRRALLILERRVLALDREDAEVAAMLFNRTGRRRSSTPDCLIAATALRREWRVVTANEEDYRSFVPYGLKMLA